jgi:hypothetical protein
MEMTVQRRAPIGTAIPGEMFIASQHAAFTLERVGVCILAGRYQVKLYQSPHFGRLMPWIQVPTRQYILLHWGDYPQNSDGCILVGKEQDVNGDIWHTQEMFQELFLPIQAAVETEGAWITLNDPLSGAETTSDLETGDL